MLSPVPEKFGKDYYYGKKESHYANYEAIDPYRQFRPVLEFIKNEKINGKFLDVGCAFGLLLNEVSPYFDDLYGCDISEYAISKAKARVRNADLKVVDISRQLPYPDEYFDFVTALDVLEHTEDLERSFSNIVNKVKKGGYIFISMPIDAWPRKLFGFYDKDKTHISVLSEARLRTIIERQGLKVISKRYFSPFPVFYRLPYLPVEIEFILQKQSGHAVPVH